MSPEGQSGLTEIRAGAIAFGQRVDGRSDLQALLVQQSVIRDHRAQYY